MMNEDKKKIITITIIIFGLVSFLWYSSNPVKPQMLEMPDTLRINDGQTVKYYNVTMEYLYQYKMPDNSIRNVIMVNGINYSFPYVVKEGGYVNLFYKYDVIIANNKFVSLMKVK